MLIQDPNIAILGDGQMGLVCAWLLAQQPMVGRVSMWGHDPAEVERLVFSRSSPRLPGLRVPDRVAVTHDLTKCLSGSDAVISAIPTQFSRPVWERVRVEGKLEQSATIVSVAKGIENGTLLRPTEVVADALGEPLASPSRGGSGGRGYVVLSGPTIAGEMARCLPATLIAASAHSGLAAQVQACFSTSWMRVYTSGDPIGVEIAGATKNVIAIAAGILDGLHAGYNAKSALLARGLAEITRLGVALGAERETFFGLAGVGDLATTCFSPEGRNRSCGEALGRGEPLGAYLARTESVVEGVATTAAVLELARRHGVDMPITAAVHAVLYEKVDPIDAIQRLMTRELKAERVG